MVRTSQILPPYYFEEDLPEPIEDEWERVFVPGYDDFQPMPEELLYETK